MTVTRNFTFTVENRRAHGLSEKPYLVSEKPRFNSNRAIGFFRVLVTFFVDNAAKMWITLWINRLKTRISAYVSVFGVRAA